jgi:hypothetical protein
LISSQAAGSTCGPSAFSTKEFARLSRSASRSASSRLPAKSDTAPVQVPAAASTGQPASTALMVSGEAAACTPPAVSSTRSGAARVRERRMSGSPNLVPLLDEQPRVMPAGEARGHCFH